VMDDGEAREEPAILTELGLQPGGVFVVSHGYFVLNGRLRLWRSRGGVAASPEE
jgi:hypothetical protein